MRKFSRSLGYEDNQKRGEERSHESCVVDCGDDEFIDALIDKTPISKQAQLASSSQFAPQHTMHSSLNRIQAVFGFFTTVALVVSALAAVSVLFFPADETNASVQLKNVQV